MHRTAALANTCTLLFAPPVVFPPCLRSISLHAYLSVYLSCACPLKWKNSGITHPALLFTNNVFLLLPRSPSLFPYPTAFLSVLLVFGINKTDLTRPPPSSFLITADTRKRDTFGASLNMGFLFQLKRFTSNRITLPPAVTQTTLPQTQLALLPVLLVRYKFLF